ncbi:CPCC family cysteine-rich protein [Paenibacillus sp. PK3_47]|uniref:CPCC family cysteine-rich protein n=1 Tax=Paenibacillus sp. PK3_47 TaxID=2072642 RepID=UPI00201DCBDB|nr:CPCC family cysteine-rich protein [Paenibacillus sp. PK3_47]
MKREEAIDILINDTLEKMSGENRTEICMDWWGFTEESSEFKNFPEILKEEILQFDEPQHECTSHLYDPLIMAALKNQYIGVRNEYLAKLIHLVLNSVHVVEGVEEELFPCPCCGYKSLQSTGEYDICQVCFWEDDGIRTQEKYSSPNHMTLKQGQDHFAVLGMMDKQFSFVVDPEGVHKYLKE